MTLGLAFAGSVLAADATVYRCRDADQQITYTDTPCTGGDRVQLKAGNADPEAVRKLALARAELDRSAAQRLAARAAEEARAAEMERMRRVMAERDESERRDLAFDAPGSYYDYPFAGGWYSPYGRRPGARSDHSHADRARFDHERADGRNRPAPSPPFPVPRR